MKQKFKTNIIFSIIGIICIIFSIFPLIKSIFSKNSYNSNINDNRKDWVEVPFLIDE